MVGVYRLWRDMGYVVGGLVGGLAADAIDFSGAIALIAGRTAASGVWVSSTCPQGPKARPCALPESAWVQRRRTQRPEGITAGDWSLVRLLRAVPVARRNDRRIGSRKCSSSS